MSKHLILVSSLLAAVLLLVMFNYTTPAEIGPLGVLFVFIAIYVLMFGVANLIVRMFTRILGKKTGRKTYLYSAAVGFGPIMLLLAQSLGSINFWTIGLTGLFILLSCFLIQKRL